MAEEFHPEHADGEHIEVSSDQNIKGCACPLGVFLFPWFLFLCAWNEKNAVCTARMLLAVEGAVSEVSCDGDRADGFSFMSCPITEESKVEWTPGTTGLSAFDNSLFSVHDVGIAFMTEVMQCREETEKYESKTGHCDDRRLEGGVHIEVEANVTGPRRLAEPVQCTRSVYTHQWSGDTDLPFEWELGATPLNSRHTMWDDSVYKGPAACSNPKNRVDTPMGYRFLGNPTASQLAAFPLGIRKVVNKAAEAGVWPVPEKFLGEGTDERTRDYTVSLGSSDPLKDEYRLAFTRKVQLNIGSARGTQTGPFPYPASLNPHDFVIKNGNELHSCAGTAVPGCVRITVLATHFDQFTALATWSNGKWQPWNPPSTWMCDSQDYEILSFREGRYTLSEYIKTLQSEANLTKWALRIIGCIGAVLACYCIWSPIAAGASLVDKILDQFACLPCVGVLFDFVGDAIEGIGEAITWGLACACGCPCALTVMAIVWVAMRPAYAAAMLCSILLAIGACAFLKYRQSQKVPGNKPPKQNAVAPEPDPGVGGNEGPDSPPFPSKPEPVIPADVPADMTLQATFHLAFEEFIRGGDENIARQAYDAYVGDKDGLDCDELFAYLEYINLAAGADKQKFFDSIRGGDYVDFRDLEQWRRTGEGTEND